MSKKESKFQASLKKEIEQMFPGSVVIKNDPTHNQGFPDLTIFYGKQWAALECKKSEKASFQPNQKYYIQKLDAMSFARAIYPENKQEVLNDLQEAFGVGRTTRVSKCELISLDKLHNGQTRRNISKRDGETKRYGTS